MAKESSRGTAQGSASYWTPWNDLTLDEKKEFAVDAQTYGVIEDSVALTQTKKYAQGSIGGNLLDQSSGLLLLSIFGGYAHATHSGETAVYDHVFTVGESAQHQSLTFFLHDPLAAADYSYANGVVEKLELSMALKKFVEYAASVKAQSGASQSAFSPATTAENRFVPQYMTAKLASAYSTITAAAAPPSRSRAPSSRSGPTSRIRTFSAASRRPTSSTRSSPSKARSRRSGKGKPTSRPRSWARPRRPCASTSRTPT